MTIRKGEPWGTPVDRPIDFLVAESDRAVADAFGDSTETPVGLSGGDLFASVGSPPPRTKMQRLPIDLMQVMVDGDETVAVAHVVMRRGWWRGDVIAVMNVDRIGDWNVAPRAHPNDGRVDVVTVRADMTVRNRWKARKRLRTGTHVPHPQIDVRTTRSDEWTFDQSTRVWIDGVSIGSARSVRIEVRPDAFAVLI